MAYRVLPRARGVPQVTRGERVVVLLGYALAIFDVVMVALLTRGALRGLKLS